MLDIALKNVSRQRVRSLLTLLGIAIGIGLIVTLGSIGEGLNQQIEESFGDLAGVIDVSTSDNEDGITDDMINDLRDIAGVTDVIPVGSYQITRGGRGMGGMMGRMMPRSNGGMMTFTGVNPEDLNYLVGENIVAEEGRKLDESDEGEYLVLLGSTTAENQFLNLGDEIEYMTYEENDDGDMEESDTYYFEVIGILEETGDSSVDGAAYVPLKTMQVLEEEDIIESVIVKISDVDKVEDITDEISEYSDDLRAFSAITMVRQLESTLGTIQMAVYGIGAISIIVGGIGIMNTMIMSVMERKREIGIMKAIGATTRDILVQVLEESAILSGIGGVTGLLLGHLANTMITRYSTFTTVLTPELIGIGIVFSLILGMGAGLYPAWSASRLDPIEVLKYE